MHPAAFGFISFALSAYSGFKNYILCLTHSLRFRISRRTKNIIPLSKTKNKMP